MPGKETTDTRSNRNFDQTAENIGVIMRYGLYTACLFLLEDNVRKFLNEHREKCEGRISTNSSFFEAACEAYLEKQGHHSETHTRISGGRPASYTGGAGVVSRGDPITNRYLNGPPSIPSSSSEELTELVPAPLAQKRRPPWLFCL